MYNIMNQQSNNLHCLNLSEQDLTDEQMALIIADINNTATITSVDVSSNQLCKVNFVALLPALTRLNLAYNELFASYLQPINHIVTLTVLKVSGNKIGNVGAVHIAESKSLIDLEANDCGINEDGIKQLAKIKSLKRLDISYNKIGNEGAIAIASHKKLEVLIASYCAIRIQGAMALSANKTLRELELNNNYIENQGINALLGLTNLTKLESVSNSLGNEQILEQDFQKAKLIELNLSYNQLKDKDAEIFFKHPSLTCLNLANNHLTDEIQASLLKNTLLTELKITNKSISSTCQSRLDSHILNNQSAQKAARNNYVQFLYSIASARETDNQSHIIATLPNAVLIYILTFINFSYIGKTTEQAIACAEFILIHWHEISQALQDKEVTGIKIIEHKGEYFASTLNRFSLFKVQKSIRGTLTSATKTLVLNFNHEIK